MWLEKAVGERKEPRLTTPSDYSGSPLDGLGCTIALLHNLDLAGLDIDHTGLGQLELSKDVLDIGHCIPLLSVSALHTLRNFGSSHWDPGRAAVAIETFGNATGTHYMQDVAVTGSGCKYFAGTTSRKHR